MISVVLPVHNEAAGLAQLFRELHTALQETAFEVIAVDDASTDASADVIEAIASDAAWLRPVLLRHNVGQTLAVATGIACATGDVIVLMDSDGQNDPRDIPALLAKMAEGFDVVSGWRIDRTESLPRRAVSAGANRALRHIAGAALHDSGCSLKAYRADLLRELVLLRDDHRFLPALACTLGARVGEVPVRDRPRAFGRSHYGYGRVPRVAIDLFGLWFHLRARGRPLRAAARLGGLLAAMWVALSVTASVMGQIAVAMVCLGIGVTAASGVLLVGALFENASRGGPTVRIREHGLGVPRSELRAMSP